MSDEPAPAAGSLPAAAFLAWAQRAPRPHDYPAPPEEQEAQPPGSNVAAPADAGAAGTDTAPAVPCTDVEKVGEQGGADWSEDDDSTSDGDKTVPMGNVGAGRSKRRRPNKSRRRRYRQFIARVEERIARDPLNFDLEEVLAGLSETICKNQVLVSNIARRLTRCHETSRLAYLVLLELQQRSRRQNLTG